jgi:hypothetical protein
MLRAAAYLCAALLLSLQPATAQTCTPVEMEGDTRIEGIAPPDGVVCYDLRFPQGQNLSLEVLDGINVSLTVPGYYDARNDRQFIGNLPGKLEIRVFQLMRSVTEEPFTVLVRFEPPGNG